MSFRWLFREDACIHGLIEFIWVGWGHYARRRTRQPRSDGCKDIFPLLKCLKILVFCQQHDAIWVTWLNIRNPGPQLRNSVIVENRALLLAPSRTSIQCLSK